MHDLLLNYVLPCLPILFGMLWGGCCCNQCTFFTDNFTRADSDDPGAYTEVSGDWDISSNTLVTSSSNGVLIADAEHPDAEPNIKVSVTVNIATSGDTARIILDYVDSDNYWFAEVKAGTGAYLRIYQRSGGSNVQKASQPNLTISTGNTSLCVAIIGGTKIAASITGNAAAQFDSSFSSAKWGLGSGSLSGTISFSGLSASRVDLPACPRCDTGTCISCIDGIPLEGEYVIADLVDGSCPCSGWNATYIARINKYNAANDSPGLGGTCAWANVAAPDLCGSNADLFIRLPYSEGSLGRAHAAWFRMTPIGDVIVWGTNDTECLNLVNKNIPYYTDSFALGFCDKASATCTVTTF